MVSTVHPAAALSCACPSCGARYARNPRGATLIVSWVKAHGLAADRAGDGAHRGGRVGGWSALGGERARAAGRAGDVRDRAVEGRFVERDGVLETALNSATPAVSDAQETTELDEPLDI
jgi:hypothetical protein